MEDMQGERGATGARGSRGERGERGDDAVMGLTIDEQRGLIKEAVREWMDECFAAFGRWSAMGILTMVVGGLVVFLITHAAMPTLGH